VSEWVMAVGEDLLNDRYCYKSVLFCLLADSASKSSLLSAIVFQEMTIFSSAREEQGVTGRALHYRIFIAGGFRR
jgi:hypothetical protein